MKKTITNFMSSRWNLTIFQYILYGIVGYIMGQYLTWVELGIMVIVMFGIQFITRIKGVSDGMMMGHLMIENEVKSSEFLQIMKNKMDKINKEDLN